MGMREQDRIDVAGFERGQVPIAQPQLFVTLEQTAIDEQALNAMLHKVLGPGDGIGSAQKSDVDAHAVSISRKGGSAQPRAQHLGIN